MRNRRYTPGGSATPVMSSTKRRAIGGSAVGLTLVANLVMTTAGLTAASAAPIGQVHVETAPAAIPDGSGQSNLYAQEFEERADLTLPTALQIDVVPSPTGTPTTIASTADLQSGLTIPGGTAINSYFFLSDPSKTSGQRFAGTLQFNSKVLGVILTSKSLNQSDSIVGALGTTYQQGTGRGLDLTTGTDSLTLDPDGDVDDVSFNVETYSDTDQFRVITAGTLSSGTPAGGTPTQPFTSPKVAPQYTEVASDGGLFNFGSAFYGSEGGTHLNQPMVGGAASLITAGYWTVARDGGIFSFNAPFYGSTGGLKLNEPIVGMAADETGLGYWLFASDGGLFSFGDAPFLGSEGGSRLARPVVGGAGDPTGIGYWMVASDGGVFSFGDAKFYGSTGADSLNQPIVGMAATPDGQGYWLVAADGGVFSFGDAAFYGSTGGLKLNQPIVGMKSTPDGEGYWLFASDGGVFSFGDATFLGSEGGASLNKPVVGGF
jgi:hypothetical protein